MVTTASKHTCGAAAAAGVLLAAAPLVVLLLLLVLLLVVVEVGVGGCLPLQPSRTASKMPSVNILRY
jgi:hypothetical protein